MEAVLSEVSTDLTDIELEKVSVSEIWNLRTVW